MYRYSFAGKSVIKHEPGCETMTPKVTKPEMPKIKQEPETECANNTSLADFSAGYVAKRKSGEASGAESPGKKKPKLEKFIVAHAQCENGDRVGGGDMWRQTAPAVARSGTKKKKKKEKQRKEKDNVSHHTKKSKKKNREDLSLVVKMEAVDEEDEEEAADEEERMHQLEKEKKKKERRKRKRKERRRVVRVTGLEEDRVMEIMDRTPTPSTPTRIKQEVLKESESEDERGESCFYELCLYESRFSVSCFYKSCF